MCAAAMAVVAAVSVAIGVLSRAIRDLPQSSIGARRTPGAGDGNPAAGKAIVWLTPIICKE